MVTMRVAACISGRLRSLKHVFPGIIEHVLAPSNADVFIWAKGCKIQEVYEMTKAWPKVEVEVGEDKIYDQEMLTACNKRARNSKGTVKSLLGQTQSVKECNNMRNRREVAEGFKYDLVIRLRTDLKFYTSILDPHQYDPSLLYIPNWGDHDGVNDRFAIAGPDVMDEYAKWGDEVVDNILQHRTWFKAERTLKAHIDIHGLVIAPTDIRFGICRRKGNIRLYGMPPVPETPIDTPPA